MKKLPPYSKIVSEHIIKPYDQIVDIYTEKHFDEKILIPLLGKFAKLLPKKARVLDAGCGPGGQTKFLLAKGFDVVGIDVSPKMIAKAREIVPNGNFLEMDVAKLDFENNSFDAIWSARALIHIPSKMMRDVLAGFHKVLNSEGIVCITVLTGNGERIEPECYDPTHSSTTFFHYFKQGELEESLQDVGFEVTDVQKTYLGGEMEEHYTVYAKKIS